MRTIAAKLNWSTRSMITPAWRTLWLSVAMNPMEAGRYSELSTGKVSAPEPLMTLIQEEEWLTWCEEITGMSNGNQGVSLHHGKPIIHANHLSAHRLPLRGPNCRSLLGIIPLNYPYPINYSALLSQWTNVDIHPIILVMNRLMGVLRTNWSLSVLRLCIVAQHEVMVS